jgi:DNA-binding MarR family transcriptional regulator
LNVLDPVDRRELEILTSIAAGPTLSQRALAQRLGIALGLANLGLKRLARKGYIKVTTVPPHRLKYVITRRGLAHKTRLTYAYMADSLGLYRDVREGLREALAPLAQNGAPRVALYGAGEAVELAYLALCALDVAPAAILGDAARGAFLGHPVRPVSEAWAGDYDYVVAATFGPPTRLLARLERQGIPRRQIVTLPAAIELTARPASVRS